MSRGREALVGFVIVAAVAVAAVGTLWLQQVSWGGDQRTVEAGFAEVGQLMNGNAVKLRGVNIGRVREISVEADGKAVRVTMQIQSDVTLPADPVVILSPESMFGDWQAEIAPRTRFPRFSYVDIGEEGVLPGHTLPDISRLTATADEIADNIRTLTDRVELAFSEETARNLAGAINNIQDVSEELTRLVGQQATTFENLADRVEASADELGSAARSARGAFDKVDRILAGGQVDSLVADSRVAARNVRDLSANLNTTSQDLRGTLQRADSTFARLDRITARVDRGEGSLGRLLTDTLFITRATDALTEIQTLLADFRTNPSRYVRLSIF